MYGIQIGDYFEIEKSNVLMYAKIGIMLFLTQ